MPQPTPFPQLPSKRGVEQTKMADPKSTANRPLWLMAVSLAVIAVCLVILVMRMHTMTQPDTKQTTPAREQRPAETEARHIPSFARPARHHDHEEPHAIVAQPIAVQADRKADDDNQPLIPVVAREPEPVVPVTGLAPISAPETNTGVITGRVFLQGKPPPETPIHLDAFCGGVHLKSATTHNYVVSKDGGLANVFVYIKSGLQQKDFAVPAPAVVNQVGCEFVPSALGLMSGQELIITNSDAHLHDVDAIRGKRTLFNIGERPNAFIEKRFTGSQTPISLKCDIHPWMEAYVWVVDNPFFAVTDSQGNYTITNVPPGEYEIAALHIDSPKKWHESAEHITVKKGSVTEDYMVIDLELPLGAKNH